MGPGNGWCLGHDELGELDYRCPGPEGFEPGIPKLEPSLNKHQLFQSLIAANSNRNIPVQVYNALATI